MWEVLSAIQIDLAKINTNAQNRVFDPGTKANYMYFQSGNGEKKLAPERYLIKTVRCEKDTISAAARAFFDKGADFCGVSEEFVEQQGWMKGVVDHGAMQVTYDNGKTVTFKFAFYLCHIPNQCDVMLGVPWKRLARPIIDWETDRILSKEAFIQERYYYSIRFGFTKHITLKQADKIIRKQDVEY
ncbi:uncharacterized protein PITG_21901 [Phytophthora infestans T30-4]|uniref:Uncharacterized protein n=1 Tax=Phytophthora infestans (strain T30-4) TaxID=403677 RepID=D0P4M7_PHYIT|nr:uncharacterized protein PITG_21901 [Phytophthora infestans T30-4]EEY67628.1 conserved hypothetical protein [Phytophthora infestans T30-4]|eukprot:XP_002894748.1 conserved hypothetical protein [Phytophthora infestans T30-4]